MGYAEHWTSKNSPISTGQRFGQHFVTHELTVLCMSNFPPCLSRKPANVVPLNAIDG